MKKGTKVKFHPMVIDEPIVLEKYLANTYTGIMADWTRQVCSDLFIIQQHYETMVGKLYHVYSIYSGHSERQQIENECLAAVQLAAPYRNKVQSRLQEYYRGV